MRSQGRDPAAVEREPDLDIGEFKAFREPGVGRGFATSSAVLGVGAPDGWYPFLGSGTVDAVAPRFVATLYGGRLLALPDGAASPALDTLPDGTRRLVVWVGFPPGFAPTTVTVSAPVSGPAVITRQAPSAAPPSNAYDAAVAMLGGSAFSKKAGAQQLGYLRDPRAVPVLVPLLADSWQQLRYETVKALARIGAQAAADPLAEAAMTEPDAITRSEEVRAIVAIGGPAARRALDRLASTHPDAALRAQAAAALHAVP